ncbi:MAG: ABC transporter ATP-binding protein [Bacillota bacterium]
MRKIFNDYLQQLLDYGRVRVLLNVALTIFLGFFNGVNTVMLLPLLSLTGLFPGTPSQNSLAAQAERIFTWLHLPFTLGTVLLLYFLVTVGLAWLKRQSNLLGVALQQGFVRVLRVKTYQALTLARWDYLLARKRSDLSQVLTLETSRVGSGTNFLLQAFGTALVALVQVMIAFWLSWQMTALVFACGIILFLCLQRQVRESQRLGRQISGFTKELFAEVHEYLGGIKEVKSYALESAHIRDFENINRRIEQNFNRFSRIQGRTTLWYNISAAGLVSLFLYVAVLLLKVPAGNLLVLIIIFGRLWPMFSSFQNSLQHIAVMLPAFEAIAGLEQAARAAREYDNAAEDVKPLKLESSIRFERISFRYPNQIVPALCDLNMEIPAGGMIAFTGISGSGKTTLVDLLIGLLSPCQGKIYIDGQPLHAGQLVAWRRAIGYVAQDAFLRNGTIRENLAWVAPRATEAELWQALEAAACAEVVRHLPQGLDTVIGDRGVRLSGGERQRVVLARALLRRPALLILDEATSSLDNENERKIQEAIEALRGKMTIVVIAHRLSTIQNADRIVVLEDGKIIETGTYAALAAKEEGRLRSLIRGNLSR